MIIRTIFIALLLYGCSNLSKKDSSYKFEFSDDLSFEESKVKLDEYAVKNPYPNIDD